MLKLYRAIILACMLLVSTAQAAVIPTSANVTIGSLADPSSLTSSQFNKYDNSTYVQTSDGTSTGTVVSVWHYSITAQKWFKVPTGSSDTVWGSITGTLADQVDLQSALGQKAAISSISTVGFTGQYSDLLGIPTITTGTVPEGTNLYYTDARSRNAISAGSGILYNASTGVISASAPSTTKYSLSAAVSSTSNVLTVVPSFSIPVVAGKTYRVEVTGTYQTAATTTGGAMGFTTSAGATGTISGYLSGKVTSTATATPLVQTIYAVSTTGVAGSSLTTTGVGATNTPHYIGGVATFTCTGSGTLNVLWGSEVNASAARLNQTSAMFVTAF